MKNIDLMKKFKLIKQYPGSPKLGTIVSFDTIVTSQYGIISHYFSDDGLKIPIEIVENNPEFWELFGADIELKNIVTDAIIEYLDFRGLGLEQYRNQIMCSGIVENLDQIFRKHRINEINKLCNVVENRTQL